ncbi:MAG: hypothetical protein V3U74_03280, partial [Thermodesulfobacteriota bacterium]
GSFENCEVRLGDIFHSTPKVVGSPSPLFFDTGFQNFAKNFRTRSGVVYAGANDGFLHAFHAGEFINASPDNPEPNPLTKKDETVPFFDIGTGEELFAFASPSFIFNARETDSGIPTESGFFPDYRFGDFKQFVLGEASLQRSWMDGSALVADIFIDGYPNGITDANSEVPCTTGTIGDPDGKIDICGKEWHTLLMMTPRNGGGVINVLDITNPDETNRTGDPLNNPDSLKFKTGTDSIPYPQHLWSMFDKNFGNMWADPVVGRVKMQTRKGGDVIFVDRWVVFVAGGLDPLEVDPLQVVNTNIGNAFYAIDIATGKIIYKVSAPPPTGVETNATETHDAMVCDLPGTVGAFDVNGDGYIDLVYTGDRCGRLWRFDVSMPFFDKGTNIALTGIDDNPDFSTIDSGGQSVWTASVAFCANVDANCNPADTPPFFPDNVNNQQVHKIFFAPTAVIDDLGRRHIIFVTGDRREPSNLSDEGVLVSFIDPYIPNVLSGSVVQTSFPATLDFDDFAASLIIDLTDQGAAADPDTRQFTNDGLSSTDGEFIVRFPNNSDPKTATQPEDRGGEKGFGSPVVINRVLIWTTFAPGALDNPCEEVSGKGRIFAIDYLTGEPALSRVPGATSMLEGSDDEIKLASGRDVAEGMPTPAQLSFGARGSVVLVVAFSGSASKGSSQFLVWELPPFPTRTQTLFWEEVF